MLTAERCFNYALTRFQRLLRHCLRLLFRFDRWHIIPLSNRPYARDIISYLNSLPKEQRTNVLEIGCGLGDIIRHIEFKERVGLDADKNVLRAARFLAWLRRSKKMRFARFDFPDSILSGSYEVIIMVNWIHTICPQVLKGKLEEYVQNNLRAGGTIIIDTVPDKEYRYNHDIRSLTADLECHLVKLGVYRRGREVHVIAPFSVIKNKDATDSRNAHSLPELPGRA
jgi:SAM-dependent methyltransferase